MKTTKVMGENNRHKVLLYAISTCGWCQRAKSFLKDNSIEYEYIDVDLCTREDQEKIREDILQRKGRLSYPVIIIDNKSLMNGFHEDKIKEALES